MQLRKERIVMGEHNKDKGQKDTSNRRPKGNSNEEIRAPGTGKGADMSRAGQRGEKGDTERGGSDQDEE